MPAICTAGFLFSFDDMYGLQSCVWCSGVYQCTV